MRLVIIQPHFLPFIGYFDLMQRADVFLYYDTAQFVKRTWHSRTYISYNGQARLISLPIETAQNGSRRPLNLMRLADHIPWRKDMARYYVAGTLRELAGLPPQYSGEKNTGHPMLKVL